MWGAALECACERGAPVPQDAHNLAWKLAEAVNAPRPGAGRCAAHPILRTYEPERRPVAVSNTILSKKNFGRVVALARALGVDGDQAAALGASVSGPSGGAPAEAVAAEHGAPPKALREPPRALVEAALALARRPLRSLEERGHPVGEVRARRAPRNALWMLTCRERKREWARTRERGLWWPWVLRARYWALS